MLKLVSILSISLSAFAMPVCKGRLVPEDIALVIDSARPPAVDPDHRMAAVRALPVDGQLRQLKPDVLSKIATLRAVLQVHAREAVYAVVVIDVPQAWIGLHERSVVLVSLPALTLLDEREMQAQVAHEIGHEYVWTEYREAMRNRDNACLRQLELFCDGIAAMTMHRAGLDERFLVSSLAKILVFNRRFGVSTRENGYPSLSERKEFIRKVFELCRATSIR